MFKNLLLFNINLESSHPDYQKLIISSIFLYFGICISVFFSSYNYLLNDLNLFYTDLVFLAVMCTLLILNRIHKNVSIITISTLISIYIGILAIIYVNNGQELMLFWALICPYLSMTLMSYKKGIIYNTIFL